MGMMARFREHETCSETQKILNPDPNNWKLLKLIQLEYAYLLYVKYHDCNNFEGKKIIVYSGQYVFNEKLDPHFDDKSSNSPIARFEPSVLGMILAREFLANYDNKIKTQ